jgi:hypothetical protein
VSASKRTTVKKQRCRLFQTDVLDRCWDIRHQGHTPTANSSICLSHGSDRSNGRSRNAANINLLRNLANTGSVLLRAVTRDVSSLTALVASLASSVERTAVRSSAVPRDVTELAAGIALHGLSLAITSKVVGTTTLVASGRARTTSETTTAVATGEATTTHGSTTAHSRTNRVGAGASKVTGLATVVAAAAGASATQAEGRAVSLDVTKTLAVVALLGLSGSGKRASVGLVAGLLAVVAETLSRRADLSVVANIATLVASTSREGRHFEDRSLWTRRELDG